MRSQYALPLIILLLAPMVRAEPECREIPRMDRPGGSVANLPIYDQGPDGLCYAYALSQLIDARREEKNENNPLQTLTSPVYIGSYHTVHGKRQAAKDKIDRDIQKALPEAGINVELATFLQSPSKYLVKPDSPAEKRLSIQQKIANSSLKSWIWRRENIDRFLDINGGRVSDVYKDLLNRGKICSSEDLFGIDGQRDYSKRMAPILTTRHQIWNTSTPIKKTDIPCELNKSFEKTFNQPLPDLTESVKSILSAIGSDNEFKLAVFEQACKNWISIKELPPLQRFPETDGVTYENQPQAFQDKVAGLLIEHPNRPIGISYCSGFLTQRPKKTPFGDLRPECSPHASIIIGQKSIDGKCSVLIRNTLGKKCPNYLYPCEEETGQIWVPIEDLSKNIAELTWF